jgi:hypothetical protein
MRKEHWNNMSACGPKKGDKEGGSTASARYAEARWFRWAEGGGLLA